LFPGWRKNGAAVICSCGGRHHTTPSVEALEKKRRAAKDAADAEVEV